jgi:hypothetical protein
MEVEGQAKALAESYLGANITNDIARYLATKLVRNTATNEVVLGALALIVDDKSVETDDKESIAVQIRGEVERLVTMNTGGLSDPGPGQRTAAATPPPAAPPAAQPPRRITKDPKWDGERGTYQMFKFEIGHVHATDAACFSNNERRKAHLLSCIEGSKARINVFTWIRGHWDGTYNELEEYLDSQYSDRHEKEKAMQELSRIQQRKNETFNDYSTRFLQLATTAADNLSETMKITIFERGLRDEHKIVLVMLSPSSYPTFNLYHYDAVEKVERQENMKRSHLPSPAGYERSSSQPELTMGGNDSGTVMDTTGMNVRTSGRATLPAGGKGKQLRAKWVTKEELSKRRSNNWCLRCGGSNHYVDKCPYLAARRPTKELPIQSMNAKVTNEPEVEAEDDDSEEEGKA